MTAWGNVALAVEAMRRGGARFYSEALENERLLSILRTQVELIACCSRLNDWLRKIDCSVLRDGKSSSPPLPRCAGARSHHAYRALGGQRVADR